MKPVFYFKKRKKSPAGYLTYQFTSNEYLLNIHAMSKEEGYSEVIYPIVLKAVGKDIDIAPDLHMISEQKVEIFLPPSISIERVPELQKQLGGLSGAAEELQKIIKNIEEGYYERC